MDFGAPPDHARHCVRLKGAECIDMLLQPIEERCVPDQRNLHGLRHARDAVSRAQCFDEPDVVQDRKWWGERSQKVLFAECIDAVLHPHAGVIL